MIDHTFFLKSTNSDFDYMIISIISLAKMLRYKTNIPTCITDKSDGNAEN